MSLFVPRAKIPGTNEKSGLGQMPDSLVMRPPTMLKRIKLTARVASPCCCAVGQDSSPIIRVHYRLGEQVSKTNVFAILHREKANKFLGSALRTTAPDLRHDSSSVKIQGVVSRGHLRRPNRSLVPPLIDDSDSDRDDLSFAFGNLSITLSSTNSSSRYYSCGLILLFFLINMFNMFSIRVVISVAVICDISLNLVSLQHMLNLVVHFVMI
jgi:hypothetical protein